MIKNKYFKKLVAGLIASLTILQCSPIIQAKAVSTTVTAQVAGSMGTVVRTFSGTDITFDYTYSYSNPPTGLWGDNNYSATLMSSETTSSKSSSKKSEADYYILLAVPGQRVNFSRSLGSQYTMGLGVGGNGNGSSQCFTGNSGGGFSLSFIMPDKQVQGAFFYSHHWGPSDWTYNESYTLIPLVNIDIGNPSSEEASKVQQALLNYKASNATTLSDLQNIANSNIDTSKFTVSVAQTLRNEASESDDGMLAGNLVVTEISSGKQTSSSFAMCISKLAQSFNTIASSLTNYCGNYNATNASSPSDFINSIVITNHEYSINVTGWNKSDATPLLSGNLSCSVNILDNGSIVKSIQVSKSIAKLADTATMAKSAIDSALSNYTVTNATTSTDLLALAKSVVNTNYITVTTNSFSKTNATETTKGSLSYLCNIKDTYGNSSTSSINSEIPVLNQSMDTLFNLYNTYVSNLSAYNDIKADDILKGVLVTNPAISASISNYKVVNATDTAEGSVKGTLTLKQSGVADRTIDIDKIISRLAQTGLTAKSYIVSALSNFAVSNNTTQSDYENLINSTIDTLKVKYSISGFKVTLATENTRGAVTGLITLNDSYGNMQTVNILNPIDYLQQSLDTVASLYDTNMLNFIPFNTTTENDILGLVNISNADISAKMINYFVDPATDVRKGRITGIILLSNSKTGKTKSVAVNMEINYLEQEMATAVKITQNYIKSLTPSNTMDFTAMLNQINTLITNPDIAATWDYGTSSTVEKEATETSSGSINKNILITNTTTGVTVNVPVTYVIPKLDYTVPGVKKLVENALSNYTPTNYTDEDNLLNYFINNISDIASSKVSIKIDNFSKVDSSETAKGALNGFVTITDGTNNESVSLSGKTIELLPQTIDGISELISNSCGTLNVNNNTNNITLVNSLNKLITGANGSKISLVIDSDKFLLKPSTIDSTGKIDATVEIIDSSAHRLLLPITVTIGKLPQTVDDALTKAKGLLDTYSASNSTTQTTIEDLVKTVITGTNGSVISMSISDFEKTESDDKNDGKITGTLDINNDSGTSSEYGFTMNIVRTASQKASGVYTDINNLVSSIVADPTKITSADDLINLIKDIESAYPGATVDSTGITTILPSSTSAGSINGNIEVKVGSETRIIPIDTVIPQTDTNKIDGVKEKINDIINSIITDPTQISNSSDLTNLINNAVTTSPGVTVDTSGITTNVPSSTSTGSIKGSIIIASGSKTYSMPIDVVIPQTEENKVTGIKDKVNDLISSIVADPTKVSGIGDIQKLIEEIQSKYPGAIVDISGLSITTPSSTSAGSIKGNIIITAGSTVFNMPIDTVIPQSEKNKVDGVVDEIKTSIEKIDISNSTSLGNIDSIVDAIKSKYPDATIDSSKLTYIASTADENGSISGAILVTIGGVTESVPISIVIPKDTAAKLTTVSQEITGYIIANKVDTESAYSDYIANIKTKYPDITLDTSGIVITKPTSDAMGSIAGNIVLTSGSFSSTANLNFPLSKLPAAPSGGGVGGGTPSLVSSEVASTTAIVTTTVDKANVTVVDPKYLEEILNLPPGSVKVMEYKWTAYKDTNIINSGKIQAVYQGESVIGVLVDSTSPLDSDTNIDISFLNDSNLSKVYVYNSDTGKYILSNKTVANVDGSVKFTGDNKSTYIVTAGEVTNPNFTSKSSGWVKSDSSNKWYYVDNTETKTGWILDNGSWYYINLATKSLDTGWDNINSTWYYLNETQNNTGAMQTGWVYKNSNWYYLNKSGSMATGWIYSSNSWYYCNNSGEMKSGWTTVNGKSYYLDNNGVMLHDIYVDGYYLDSNGAAA